MSQQYEAAKDLVINGVPIKAGDPIPDGTDPERVQAGLKSGSIRRPQRRAAAPKPVEKPVDPPKAVEAERPKSS